MDFPSHTLRYSAAAWISCLFFIAAGSIFIPLIGLQYDEALFAEAIYHPRAEFHYIQLGHSRIPTMIMTYVGALKAWLYRPIFGIFGPGVYSLRLPMVLAGATSLWIFFLLLRRIADHRIAVVGCLLLAVDASYLLTCVFDWGPVALQHLLLLGGGLLLVRFYQTMSNVPLWWGFFLWGLAMWDKALAIWLLSGIGIAAILTFPRQIFAVTTKKRVLLAAVAFLLGALPLVICNIEERGATFRGNFSRDTASIPAKLQFLIRAADEGLFWVTLEDWQTPTPHQPQGWLQTASSRISEAAGRPRRHFLSYAFLLALIAAPFAGGKALRIVIFGLIVMAVAWSQMAINGSTGGSVHHTILLWPLPQLIIAVSLVAASRRLGRAGLPALAAVMTVFLIAGLLVVNENYVLAWRNGGGSAWTDAIFRLSDSFRRSPPKQVLCVEWGILGQLRLLHAGKLPLGDVPMEEDQLRAALADTRNVFVLHTKPYEVFPENAAKLKKVAADAGYQGQLMETISDTHGRPVYELYRFQAPVSTP